MWVLVRIWKLVHLFVCAIFINLLVLQTIKLSPFWKLGIRNHIYPVSREFSKKFYRARFLQWWNINLYFLAQFLGSIWWYTLDYIEVVSPAGISQKRGNRIKTQERCNAHSNLRFNVALKESGGKKKQLKINLLKVIFSEHSTVHVLHWYILLHFGKDYLLLATYGLYIHL